MSEKSIETKPNIPATLVAHVHNTTANAVRTARSRWTPATDKYQQTTEEIASAVEAIKQSKQ